MNRARDVGELLAGQLEAVEADMLARARPYAEALQLRHERDEYKGRVLIAAAVVADMPCECARVQPFQRECSKCYLEKILDGGAV